MYYRHCQNKRDTDVRERVDGKIVVSLYQLLPFLDNWKGVLRGWSEVRHHDRFTGQDR